MTKTTNEDRRELLATFRKVAEDRLEEILKVMPDEAQAKLLRRSVVRHLMDGSCHLDGYDRADHMLTLVERLKQGELSVLAKRIPI